MQDIYVFENGCLCSISGMRLEYYVSESEIKHKVLCRRVHSLGQALKQISLRWLVRVTLMPIERLSCCTLFLRVDNG